MSTPPLGPRTEKRETFTRLGWHLLRGAAKERYVNTAFGKLNQLKESALRVFSQGTGIKFTSADEALRYAGSQKYRPNDLTEAAVFALERFEYAVDIIDDGDNLGECVTAAVEAAQALQFAAMLQDFGEMLSKHVSSELAKKIRTEAAKHALSFRGDQKQKSSWQQHVQCCVEGGREISNICDLLNIEGYEPSLAHIPHTTLKKWAKEVVPALKFKAGRPK